MALFALFLIICFSVFSTIHSNEFYSNSSHSISDCIVIEGQILVSFKQGLRDPTGKLSSWRGKDCCKWSGVSCSNRTGHVTKLDLRSSSDQLADLTGTLNPLLFDLKYLTYLDLSGNDFESSGIPSSIGSMRRLRYLNLSLASFSGMVPPHFGNLSNLLYLDLHASKYSNTYGSNIWLDDLNWLPGLAMLKYLNLGYINLSSASTGWLQAMSSLSSIEELHLPGCYLHDLPQSPLVPNFTSLSVLNLTDNGFNTILPSWLLNITTLKHLSLKNAGIRNSIDNIQCQHLCDLQSLDLSSNGMSGEITRFIHNLSSCSNVSMTELQLSFNNLHGELPESLGQLKNLRSLCLTENKISGPVPASVGNLSHLKVLYLAYNELNGTLPRSIGQLEELVTLNLLGNYWDGFISEVHFLNLKSLKIFRLSSWNKSLAFDVRSNWVPSFNLTFIWIHHCQMDPQFPLWLKTQRQLSHVLLEEVGISGEIPDWFWKNSPQLMQLSLYNNKLSGKLPKLLKFAPNALLVDLSYNLFSGLLPNCSPVDYLLLSNNLFSGPIPATTGSQIPISKGLDLSQNSLIGEIPKSIGKLTNLVFLSLSSNKLTGEIPQLKGLHKLCTLDLSSNHLVGRIPESLCSLPKLSKLILNNNNLSGNLKALRNCTHLSKLSIGDNHFTGNIPRWIGEAMHSLSVLSLRGNFFIGAIPDKLCQLPSLHILDLSNNNLSGTIPSCVGSLTGLSTIVPYTRILDSKGYIEEMELNVQGRTLNYTTTLDLVNIIDLSRNNLKGEIPEGIANLFRLGTLNLSHNQLFGNITNKIGFLTLLETLDLSFNHLSGPIPASVAGLTALSHLNLSYNNLSGPIPSANQFQTLPDPSVYAGNLYLCGSPLPGNCSTLDNEDPERKANGVNENDENGLDRLWFYLGLAPGFIVGYLAVCGPLAIKKSWRHRYFRSLDNVKDQMHVAVVLCLARCSRKLKGEAH